MVRAEAREMSPGEWERRGARWWRIMSSRRHRRSAEARTQAALALGAKAWAWAHRWKLDHRLHLPRLEAAAATPAWSSPASPAPKLDCRPRAAMDRSRSHPQAGTSPDWAERVAAPASAVETGAAAA